MKTITQNDDGTVTVDGQFFINQTLFMEKMTEDEREEMVCQALRKLRAKAKIAQGDYVPNWDDNNPKYFPVFDMRNGGFVYTFAYCAYTGSDAMVGSRFCFPTKTAAEKFGKDNLELYRILYKG